MQIQRTSSMLWQCGSAASMCTIAWNRLLVSAGRRVKRWERATQCNEANGKSAIEQKNETLGQWEA